ncbi:hypothetical protein [Streptomyces sp. NPDC055886]
MLGAAGDGFCPGGDRTEFGQWLEEDPTGRGIRVAGEKARRVCEALLNSYAAATRPADPAFLDAELMASVAAATRRPPAGGNAAGGAHS